MLSGIMITQKYLEKGHTQMEYDTMHASVEKRLKYIYVIVWLLPIYFSYLIDFNPIYVMCCYFTYRWYS